MIDFTPFRSGEKTMADVTEGISKSQLHSLTDELYDTISDILADATDTDVVFQPLDPAANDTFGKEEDKELAWTLGHVAVHLTASAEEAAALASDLARGIVVDWRSRYETDWQTVTTITQVRTRLSESRRMCHAFLDTWPNEPQLDVTYMPVPRWGALNAVSRYALGLAHASDHLGQLREIMAQAKAGKAEAIA